MLREAVGTMPKTNSTEMSYSSGASRHTATQNLFVFYGTRYFFISLQRSTTGPCLEPINPESIMSRYFQVRL